MPAWAWRRRPTVQFGEIWIPFAQIELRKQDGRYQSLALQIDSGAVVSLLRRSMAEFLGINLTSGQQISLAGIGGHHTTAYVHRIETRLDVDLIFPAVPFAFADTEHVPNLLGRLGIFDQLQIDFDASLHQTITRTPWLNEQDAQIWKFIQELDQHVVSRWDASIYPAPANRVINMMITRAHQMMATIMNLAKVHNTWDLILIIRAFYELAAQFEYLMQESQERSQKYIDFIKVSKYTQMQKRLKYPDVGVVLNRFVNSPLRTEGEARITQEYHEVRSGFLRQNGREWDQWYCMKLRDLADHLTQSGPYNWLAEYDLWYAEGSAWTHGDPFQLSKYSHEEETVHKYIQLSYHYYCRMLKHVTSTMVLTNEQYQVIKVCSEDFC
ncbi:MAG: hypothetical protein HJJLKODD_00441 [Phycisphaerae bacterium]|nr:hypothetical protein [Phycisphaerae bacterium]